MSYTPTSRRLLSTRRLLSQSRWMRRHRMLRSRLLSSHAPPKSSSKASLWGTSLWSLQSYARLFQPFTTHAYHAFWTRFLLSTTSALLSPSILWRLQFIRLWPPSPSSKPRTLRLSMQARPGLQHLPMLWTHELLLCWSHSRIHLSQ